MFGVAHWLFISSFAQQISISTKKCISLFLVRRQCALRGLIDSARIAMIVYIVHVFFKLKYFNSFEWFFFCIVRFGVDDGKKNVDDYI